MDDEASNTWRNNATLFGSALEAIVRQAKQDRSEPQQMREFVANGGSLIGLVQKHCEIWTA